MLNGVGVGVGNYCSREAFTVRSTEIPNIIIKVVIG